jgi:glycosyltransferase involved in cell wall biosynthesis
LYYKFLLPGFMKTLFAAFDIFPNTKGSATHIAHDIRAITKNTGPVTLICLGNTNMPGYQKAPRQTSGFDLIVNEKRTSLEEDEIEIFRCNALHPNFLKRVEFFMEYINDFLNYSSVNFNFIHFRDIWSGLPLTSHPKLKNVKKIFEVNSTPSIELPYSYPDIHKSPSLLNRIRHIEDHCFKNSDHIITISRVTKDYLIKRNIPKDKITIIHNTAEIDHLEKCCITSKTSDSPKKILYVGTLSPWQGLPTLLKATGYIKNYNITLHIVCSTKKYLTPIRKMVKKLGLNEITSFDVSISRDKLKEIYRDAYFSVAPLTRCDRNEIQGCSPLKILESMATGTPVIASDLRVCREIIDHKKDGLLFNPDSARSLAQAMEELLNDDKTVNFLGKNSQQKIELYFNKSIFTQKTKEVYLNLQNREET